MTSHALPAGSARAFEPAPEQGQASRGDLPIKSLQLQDFPPFEIGRDLEPFDE